MNTRERIRNASLSALMMIGIPSAILLGARPQVREGRREGPLMTSTIAFVSTRHEPPPAGRPRHASQIYLMDADGTNVRRLTQNSHMDDFPALSPDGTRMVFESNRLRTEGEPLNISPLFLVHTDGAAQTPLLRGNSATWSPDGKRISFHASASGTGRLVSALPGAATVDSDLFVLHVDDFLKKGARPKNITNSPAAVDDDPDWSPDGTKVVFHRRVGGRGQFQLFMINADGTGERQMTSPPGLSGFPNWGEVRSRELSQ